MTARWLVTGAGGMLGRDLLTVLAAAGVQTTALDRAGLDVTDAAAVKAAVAGHDVVVNCAAWTDVDGAEAAEQAAAAVNGDGARNLAAACADSGARLLQVSTDYVLPGDAAQPCPESAATGPVNAYGRTKLLGEQAVAALLPETGYTVRTAWLYGEHGGNFVATMLKLAAQRESLAVVDDQHGQPTWTLALAGQLHALGLAALGGTAPAGIYHGTAAGRTTWFGLAREVFRLARLDPERVRPTTADAFPRPARRPAWSVLGHARWAEAGLSELPDWQQQLAQAMERPGFAALASAARAASTGARSDG